MIATFFFFFGLRFAQYFRPSDILPSTGTNLPSTFDPDDLVSSLAKCVTPKCFFVVAADVWPKAVGGCALNGSPWRNPEIA